MQVTATVRVKAEPGERPDKDKLEEAAKLLTEFGFNVLRVGRFGVSITGEERDYERVLGVSAKPNRALTAPSRPADPELRDLVDEVEVVPEPQLY